MTVSITPQLIESLKKKARQRVKKQGLAQHQALDQLAIELGFGNWSQLHKTVRPTLQEEPPRGQKPPSSPSAEEMWEWVTDNYARAADFAPYESREGGYQYPLEDMAWALRENFPDADREELQQVLDRVEDEGPWCDRDILSEPDEDRISEDFETLVRELKLPIKKRRYQPAEILDVDLSTKTVKVAVARYWGEQPWKDSSQLVFRCPVCGKVHYHGGGYGRELGDGDGSRLAHCRTSASFFFDLVEVREPNRAGHLPKKLLKFVSAPDE